MQGCNEASLKAQAQAGGLMADGSKAATPLMAALGRKQPLAAITAEYLCAD